MRLVFLFGLLSAQLFAASQQPFHRLYVFGDSYSDIGEGYLDGDGPTAVAYLAEHLGLHLQPSNTKNIAQASLDFAVSGAQTGEGSGKKIGDALLGYGMRNQVSDFLNLVIDKKVTFNPADTLFFLAGGLNDRYLPTDTTVKNIEFEMKMLYSAGARNFAIALMPTSIPAFKEVGERLNPALAAIPDEMLPQLPTAQILLSHWGPFFDDVMREPAKYGIHNTKDACAGRALFNQDTTECKTPADHFYYHEGHPSTEVHKIVGEKLYRELFTKPLPPGAARSPEALH